jgi:hypothetical protein
MRQCYLPSEPALDLLPMIRVENGVDVDTAPAQPCDGAKRDRDIGNEAHREAVAALRAQMRAAEAQKRAP